MHRVLLVVALLAAPAGAAEFTAGRMLVAAQKGTGSIVASFDENGVRQADVAVSDSALYLGLAFTADGRLIASHDEAFDVIDAAGGITTHGTLFPVSKAATGPDGNLFFPLFDETIGQVMVITPDGAFVSNFDGGSDGGVLGKPIDVAFGADGRLYVAELATDSIAILTPDGGFLRRISASGNFEDPTSVCMAPGGELLVLSNANDQIVKLTNVDAVIPSIAAITPDPPTALARGLAVGPNGHLFAGASASVVEMDPKGKVLRTYPVDGAVLSIVFAPFRFKVRLTGRLEAPGADGVAVDENAILSIAPGSSPVLLDVAADSPLAERLSVQDLVFAAATAPAAGKKHDRVVVGQQFLGRAAVPTFASIALELAGSIKGDLKEFTPSSFAGSCTVSSAGGAARLTVKSKKLLND